MKETSDKSLKRDSSKKKSNDSEEKKDFQEESVTTKKELELRKSEQKYKQLFESANDAIILYRVTEDNQPGEILEVNELMCNMMGYTKEEILAMNALDISEPYESHDITMTPLVMELGKLTYERLMKTKSGNLIPIEVSSHTFELDKERVILGIIRDITERKKAEKSKERDRLIFQKIANAAIQTTDVPEFCNRVLSDLIDYLDFDIGTLRIYDQETEILTPLAVLGLPPERISDLRPMKLTDEQYIISQAIISKKPLFAPDVLKTPELKKYKSRLKLFEIKALISWPILDKNKNILGALQLSARNPKIIPEEDRELFESIAIMLANALERFNAEKALEKAFHEREEIDKVIEMSPAIIFLWRNAPGWPIDYVTSNVHIFGYSPEDFYSGRISYKDLIFEEDSRVERLDVDLYSQKEYPYEFPIDYRIKTKSGELKWVLEFSTPRMDINGEITHYHGIILDITERKKYEENLVRDRTTFKLIAEAAVHSKTVEDLCKNILEVLIDSLKFNEGIIRLYDPEKKILKKITVHSIDGPYIDYQEEIPVDREGLIITHVAKTKETVFAPSLKDLDFGLDTVNRISKLGIESFIAWPILTANRELYGIIQLMATSAQDLTDEDKVLFASIANLFATVLEQINTEQALLEAYNERRELDTIINLSPAIVFLWRNAAGWPVEYASDNVVVFGYSPEDFYSGVIPYSDIVYPEDLERVAKEVEEYSKDKNRQTFTQEYRIVTKSGDVRWTFDYTSIRRDEEGNITHFHGIILDTTDQKKTEESLKRAYNEREELDRTINLSPAIVFLWKNKEGWPVEFVSDNIILYGYKPEDFYSENLLFAEIIHPDDLQRIIDEEKEYVKDENCNEYVMEYRILTKSGDIRWIYNYNAVRRDLKGNVTHFQGIILDTTESKIAEESLRNERRAFQIIADATSTATTVPELCQRILSGLVDALDFDIGSIRLYDEEDQLLEAIANVHLEDVTGRKVQSIPIDSPDYINALVARTKTAIFAPDIKKHEIAQIYIERLKKMNISSVITWPLLDPKGDLLGILQLAAHKPKEIPEEDRIVFETISGTLTNAIERFIADEARKESEEKFRAFAEQSLSGVVLFTIQGKILFINEQMVKITENPKEAMLQINALEFLTGYKHDETSDILELFKDDSNKEKKIPSIREFKFITSTTNRVKWLSINITPIKLKDEIVIAAMVVDITEQKQAQLALSRERTILELISEATANNLYVKDLCIQLLEGIIKTLELESGTIRFYDKNDKMLLPYANFGIVQNEEYMIAPISIDDEKYPVARFARDRTKIFVLDAQNDAFLKDYTLVKKHKYQTYISWPIVNASNELLGMIQLGSRKITNLSEQDETFFDTITSIIGTSIEHLQVLENLKNSEDRYKSTVDTLIDGITVIENFKIVYANEQALEIYGYPREEYMNMQGFLDLAPEGEREKYLKVVERMLANQESLAEQDFWITRRDGTKRFVRNKVYVRYVDGKPLNMYIATSDITQGKIAEDSLIRERLVFKLVAEIALFSKDLTKLTEKMTRLLMDVFQFEMGSIMLVDESAKNLILHSNFGLMDFVGENPEPIPLSDEKMFITNVARNRKAILIPDVDTSELPEVFLKRARIMKLRSLIAFPIISDKDELIGVLSLASSKVNEIQHDDRVFFDSVIRLLATTIRKTQAEEELRKLNEELELRVQQRTAQLLSVNKELEAFSYSVSHDLRTPLRSIDGFSQALLEDYSDQLDETGKDYLTRVRSACTRMSDLIDDILSLSRLTRKDMDSREINLSKLANNILSEFQENEPGRKVTVKVEKNIKIFGDPTLIRTIIENLLGNAWKFTSKKLKARIDFGKKIINNEEVYFVQDDGVGFDKTYEHKLFAVFQRLHTYTEFKGTGIGLAIVQRIVNRYGGRVWAESKLGKGATFYFTLPVQQTAEEVKM